MESSHLQLGGNLKQTTPRRSPSSISLQDLWSATREGSIPGVDSALVTLKKNGGNIDTKNTFGSTALHIAVWRNHVPIVRRLLAAGADPNVRDGESGWSSLHRALHFGHLAVAGVLIEAGASLTLEDSKAQTPIDLLSGPVQQVLSNKENNAGSTDLFSWGNGANYQLGTGNTDIQKLPYKVEALQGLLVKEISAAKFHSVAVTALGELYTWGFGRGGRLGHPDFDIHSGQAAVITPRQVFSGLGQRRVVVVGAAKHHSIVATVGGEVFTWGSNREGQLGYTSVDTQATPRRVSSLKTRVIAVAAANKHSAAVTESGEVYTWGCNKEGQLGYGTSNSASNYVPRAVDSLKGQCLVAVSAAKYHTVVLNSDGEVFTWGYKMVSPRRVMIQRNTKKSGNMPLKFHCKKRLHVVKIAAGMTHSTVLSDDGSLFYWVSSDPNLHCQQLYSMTSSNVVSVSAGKYWTAIATSTGDVYAWDGHKYKGDAPVLQRIHGIKHVTSVSVGETHFLAVSTNYIPKYTPKRFEEIHTATKEHCEEDEIEDDDATSNDCQNGSKGGECGSDKLEKIVPSLKDLCQKVAAEFLVEPKNVVQLLDIADTLEAEDLRIHCEDLVLRNLDYILTISPIAFANVSPELLSKLEKSLDSKSSEPWSYRHLPTLTATFPAIIDSEEDDGEIGFPMLRNVTSAETVDQSSCERISGDGFLRQTSAADRAMAKEVRAIRKKLQQIEMLEMKQSNGYLLDEQQKEKVQTKYSLQNTLAYLETGVAVESNEELGIVSTKTTLLDGKASVENGSRNRQRKGKKKGNKFSQKQCGDLLDASKCEVPVKGGPRKTQEGLNPLKGFESDDYPVYDGGKDDDVKFGDSNISSSLQKENLVDCNDYGSDKKASIATSSDHDSELNVATKKSLKKKSKKGGLSVFLSGALDDAPKVAVQAPSPPKVEGPAWGGARITKDPTSLLEIQGEQILESNIPLTTESSRGLLKCVGKGKSSEYEAIKKSKGLADVYEMSINEPETDHIRIPRSQLVQVSSPIAVAPSKVTSAMDVEKSTPPWAGTSPLMSRSSLKEIQMQQVKQKTMSSVDLFAASGSSSKLDPSLNVVKDSACRWFKPEVSTPSPIRCIQIEEKAMKDLRRLYKNVKLVKKDTT